MPKTFRKGDRVRSDMVKVNGEYQRGEVIFAMPQNTAVRRNISVRWDHTRRISAVPERLTNLTNDD